VHSDARACDARLAAANALGHRDALGQFHAFSMLQPHRRGKAQLH
jgi:hypothetical protein